MRPQHSTFGSLAALALTGTLLSGAGLPQQPAWSASRQKLPPNAVSMRRLRSSLPLWFEGTRGRSGEPAFLARAAGYTVAVQPGEALFRLRGAGDGETQRQAAPKSDTVVHMRLEGANRSARLEAVDRTPGGVQRLLGSDPAQWRTGAPACARVRSRGVYPGIDLLFYGTEGRVEHDFTVAPGADPSRIRIAFEGTSAAELDREGNLLLHTPSGLLRERRPVCYQLVSGHRMPVDGRYVLFSHTPTHPHSHTPTRIAFRLAAYDRTKPLVIDPVVEFSTLFGGNSVDRIWAVAVDASGDAYVAGQTDSTDAPLEGAGGGNANGTDAFVAKFSADGQHLLYATYFGGSGADIASGIAVDPNGNVVVTGRTESSDFPVSGVSASYGGNADAFVVRLGRAGRPIYSRYLGGSATDQGLAIDTDSKGAAYVTGSTASPDFPTAGALMDASFGTDAFAAKLSAAGGLVYSTYLSGNGEETGQGIRVDARGRAVVAGVTSSPDFPTQDPLQASLGGSTDGFVLRLSASGDRLDFSTFLGGTLDDAALAVAVDPDGSVYVTGSTDSLNFPLIHPFQRNQGGRDAFVVKLDLDAHQIVYATYLGGSGDDTGNAIAVDPQGDAFIAGETSSDDFPAVRGLQNGQFFPDAFVAKLDPFGARLLYSTYLAGSGFDSAHGVALDSAGAAFVTGETGSSDFPSVDGLFGDAADLDGFLLKLVSAVPLAPFNLTAALHSVAPLTVRLTWQPGDTTDVGFEIERRVPNGSFSTLVTLPADATTFLDRTVQPKRTYIYRVRALSVEGESDWSVGVLFSPGRTALEVSPTRLNFGTVRRGRSKTLSLRLRNVSTGPVSGAIDSLAAPFSIVAGGGSFTLRRRASRTVRVRFTPAARGRASASLQIHLTAPVTTDAGVPVIGSGR